MSGLMDLSIVIKAVDDASKVFKSISNNVEKIGKSAGDVGKRFSDVTKEAGLLAGKLTLLGGAAIWGFKSQFIDTAAEFEKFTTVLETLEGSSAKAKQSMDWVSNFAAKTPYELAEVTDSFVKLRAYGMNPTNGLLRTLGDTSAAMGKPIIQAVEAIADAVTGENERLKEFGIRATVNGNKIRYEYSYNGRQMVKEANKNSRAMIESTLTSIFNQKYAGAMDKQSRTWSGMVSNISDQWTRFKNMVMSAGVFDFLKEKLEMLLAKVDAMAKSGQLKKWADQFGKNLVVGLEKTWQVGKELYPVFVQLGKNIDIAANAIGGYGNVAKLVLGLMAGKLVISIFGLIKSFWTFRGVLIDATKSLKLLTMAKKAHEAVTLAVWGAQYKLQELLPKISRMMNILSFNIRLSVAIMKDWVTTQLASAKAGLTYLGGLVKMGAVSLWRNLSSGVLAASRVMWGFTASLLANPITWAVAGVVALAGASYLIYKNWKPISAFFKNLWTGVINYLSSIKSKMFTAGANILKSLCEGMQSLANKPVEAIKNVVQQIRNHLPFSPAKIGPLRDIHRIKLVETIAGNIKPQPMVNAMNKALSATRQSIKSGSVSGGGSTISIDFRPSITIQGGSGLNEDALVTSLRNKLMPEFERIVSNIQAKQKRLAY